MPKVSDLTDVLLVKRFHAGCTDREIAEEFDITVAAVSKRRMKLRLVRNPVSRQVNEYLATAWKILATKEGLAHHNAHPAKSLKIWLRYQLGDQTLSEKQLRLATKWVEGLQERGEILCYAEGSTEGWYYRRRTPADGRRIVDWPEGVPLPSESFKRALDLPADPS